MIKLKIKYGNSQTDLRFPCTEKEMSAALGRILGNSSGMRCSFFL